MISLREMLDPSCVAVDVPAVDAASAVRFLVGLLDGAGRVLDGKRLVKDIIEREKLAPTGLGEGCAVPHAQSEGVDRTSLAVARLRDEVDFGSPDGSGARLIFLMAGPPDAVGAHLKLLSKLARLLHDESFRQRIGEAPTAEALAALIYDKDD